MSLASDPIDQAFPDETPTHLSGDPIDAAFPEAGSNDHGAHMARNPMLDLVEQAGSGLTHSIVGGYKGIGKLVSGQGLDAAADAVTGEQAKAFQPSPQSQKAIDWATNAAKAATPGLQAINPQPVANYAADKSADLGASPLVSTALKAAPVAAGAVLGVRGGGKASLGETTQAAQDIVNRSTADQSMGAASATHDIQAISPELQQAVVDAARKTGGAVNPSVLRNHIEAEEHGVQLMKGQATRDPDQFTEEQNSTHPDITARLNAQEGQMVNALDTVRRDASPTNVANSARENGQVALDDLKNYDAPKVKAITAAYEDANSANIAAGKGALKLDPTPGVQHATQALEDREELLPSEGQSILTKMKTAADSGQGIPLKQAETWKTVISRASRKYDRSGDTNAVNALSDFRDSLEQMSPTADAAAGVQQKFNTARGLAKQRFDEQDADPAYKAAVNDPAKVGEPSALADTFLDDYALSKGAPKSQLDLMMSKLSDEGKGAVASHTLSAVRKGAVSANGKISPNGFNSALDKYGDKLDSLVQPETQDSLESLGRVITNAKAEPAGGKVNYSRSGVIARDALQSAAEGLANAKTGGGYGILKKMLNTSENSFAKDALRPGAGLEQLTEKP